MDVNRCKWRWFVCTCAMFIGNRHSTERAHTWSEPYEAQWETAGRAAALCEKLELFRNWGITGETRMLTQTGGYSHTQSWCSSGAAGQEKWLQSLSVSYWCHWQVVQLAIYSKGSFNSTAPICDLQSFGILKLSTIIHLLQYPSLFTTNTILYIQLPYT